MKPNASQQQDLRKTKIRTKSLQKHVQEELTATSESPYLDSLVLLSHITGLSKSQLLANPDPNLSSRQENQLQQSLGQLKEGTPLPYLVGEWEFFQHKFKINPNVLIPRPETEGLVELALDWLREHPQRRTCLEIGTGCGCIAISLAKQIPDLIITATDISKDAIQIARENAHRLHVADRIDFQERDMLVGTEGNVDLIVANLPYIPTEKLRSLPIYTKEPVLALDGGRDGLDHITQLLKNARGNMNPGGAIFLELDEDTGAAALALAHEVWPGRTLILKQDLAGNDRYLTVQC